MAKKAIYLNLSEGPLRESDVLESLVYLFDRKDSGAIF